MAADSPARAPGIQRPLTGTLRLLRVAGLGGASMLLATAAHLLGGGALPSTGILLVTTFLVGLTAVTLTARRCRFWLLATGLGVEQLILHGVFSAGSLVSRAPAAADPLRAHDAAMGASLAGVHAVSGMSASPLMVASHVVATLATAWLLSRGEAWLWAFCERAIRAANAAPSPRIRRPRPFRASVRPSLTARSLPSSADPRGPPVLAWSN